MINWPYSPFNLNHTGHWHHQGHVVVTVQPTIEPVTLDEAKAQCRIDIDDDDLLVTALIQAAREYCEKIDWRSFMTQTIQLWLDHWPWPHRERWFQHDMIELPRPPLQSVTSITLFDENDAETVVDESIYIVDTVRVPGRIVLRDGESWPNTTLRAINGICIEYIAGWTAQEYFPARLKQAMLLLIGYWYESREAGVIGVPKREIDFSVRSLLGVDRAFEY